MGNHVYKILGTIFLSLSGVFYTSERIAEKLGSSIKDAGSLANSGSSSGLLNYPGFLENFFVWLFFIIGFLLLAFGFKKNKE